MREEHLIQDHNSRKYKTGHLVAVQPELGGVDSGEVEKGGGERIRITDLKVP